MKTLRGILNNKARKKEPRGNNYFTIAVDVYILQHHKASKLEWAIDEIAEKNNISSKTVKNHIAKFRREIKEEISILPKGANYSSNSTNDVNKFINSYIREVYSRVENYGTLYELDRPYQEYRHLLDTFIREIVIHSTVPEINIDEDNIPF